MKLIICGPRDYTSGEAYRQVLLAMNEWLDDYVVTEIVEGGAPGVDALAKRWAKNHGKSSTVDHVPYKTFKPDWTRYGALAGPRRNREMAEYADACIAIVPEFNGTIENLTKGTRNMIRTAICLGLITRIWVTDKGFMIDEKTTTTIKGVNNNLTGFGFL